MATATETAARISELAETDELHAVIVATVAQERGPRWSRDHGFEALELRLVADRLATVA